ncbi:hypothetical protein Bca4012_064954 [Brassica carinata]
MLVVPGWSSKLQSSVDAILSSAGRDNLPVLNPGPGILVDTTTVTWFRFLHDLSVAIPEILHEGWVHAWPTYRLIPTIFKERWFLKLARRCTWYPRHTLKVWTNFNRVATTLFRGEIRRLKRIWAHGGQKPDWMLTRVWLDLIDMFIEFVPDNFGF